MVCEEDVLHTSASLKVHYLWKHLLMLCSSTFCLTDLTTSLTFHQAEGMTRTLKKTLSISSTLYQVKVVLLFKCSFKCNLTVFTTKNILCCPKGLQNCYAHACPSAFVSTAWCPAVFCEALMPVHLSGVCVSLHFAVFVWARARFEQALVRLCSQQASFVLMQVDPSCAHCSAILPSSIVSGFPPPPSLVSIVYIIIISVTGAFLPFCMGIYGWVAEICQVWEQSPLGAGCQ